MSHPEHRTRRPTGLNEFPTSELELWDILGPGFQILVNSVSWSHWHRFELLAYSFPSSQLKAQNGHQYSTAFSFFMPGKCSHKSPTLEPNSQGKRTHVAMSDVKIAMLYSTPQFNAFKIMLVRSQKFDLNATVTFHWIRDDYVWRRSAMSPVGRNAHRQAFGKQLRMRTPRAVHSHCSRLLERLSMCNDTILFTLDWWRNKLEADSRERRLLLSAQLSFWSVRDDGVTLLSGEGNRTAASDRTLSLLRTLCDMKVLQIDADYCPKYTRTTSRFFARNSNDKSKRNTWADRSWWVHTYQFADTASRPVRMRQETRWTLLVNSNETNLMIAV